MAGSPERAWTEADLDTAVADYIKNAKPIFARAIQGPPGVSLFPEENLQFNLFGQQPFLLINRIPFHELPVRLLQRLPVYLVRQFEIQVEVDSRFYWALTHDVFRYLEPKARWPLHDSFEVLMASVLAHLGQAPSTPEADTLNRVLREVVPPEVQDLARANTAVAMFLSYPIVEGLAKHHLRDYLDVDGRVKQALQAGPESFKTTDRPVSNLGRLLRGLQAAAGPTLHRPDLERDLADFRVEAEAVGRRGGVSFGQNPGDAWDWIYGLRNDLLHGATRSPFRSGLLTNLACLLLWHSVSEPDLQNPLDMVRQRLSSGIRSLMPHAFGDYYPPAQ